MEPLTLDQNPSMSSAPRQGINHFRHKEFEPARNRFVQVLRDARCIGGSEMEARALGNLATVRAFAHAPLRKDKKISLAWSCL